MRSLTAALNSHINHSFPAFRHTSYRLYFLGQLISFTGSWLQGVAFGWLVYTLTHSAFWLGAVSAVSSLPVLCISLFGGFLVDRYDRKKLLYLTQGSQMILAALLGFLTLTHSVTIPTLLLITLLSGVANAVDNPTTNAFVVDIVSKDDLPSAIGLNSTMFNTGRVLGPAAAGFLIAMVGEGNIFLINAASFLAILISLFFIKSQSKTTKSKDHPIKAIKEGITYSYSHPFISLLLLTAGIGAVFMFSQATIMPVYAQKVFGGNSVNLGYLLSATGAGALIASLIISSQSKRCHPKIFIVTGSICFLVSSFLFSFTTNIILGSGLLFFAGLGLTLQFSTIYATIQKLVSEEFRGRVSSIYVLLFIGLGPLGNLFIGSATSRFGPQIAVRVCVFMVFLYAVFVYLNLGKIKSRYKLYQQQTQTPLSLALNSE